MTVYVIVLGTISTYVILAFQILENWLRYSTNYAFPKLLITVYLTSEVIYACLQNMSCGYNHFFIYVM